MKPLFFGDSYKVGKKKKDNLVQASPLVNFISVLLIGRHQNDRDKSMKCGFEKRF